MLASYSVGARERLKGLLADHGLTKIAEAESWQEALGAAAKGQVALTVIQLDHGFTTADVALLTEQDMLGDRLVRRRSARRAPTPSSPSSRRSAPAISSSTPITASAATRA